MARTRTRPTRRDTIDQLIDGARRAFVDRGFYGARIEDICASAGLTRGAFYSAFGKKEDLFYALYDRMISEVSELFIAGLDQAERGYMDPIDALFRSLAEHFPIGRDWYVLNAEFTLFAIRDVDAAKSLATRRHALRVVIADKLNVALTRSGRMTSISPELFARAVIGLADAGLGQSLIEPDALNATTLLQTFMAPLVRSLSIPDDGNVRGTTPTDETPVIPKFSASHALPTTPEPDIDRGARRRLLAAAEAAFIQHGYGKARVSDIAAMAGISKKTIYAHANSKSALFAAVVHEAIGRAVSNERLDPGGQRGLEETLSTYLAAYARRCFSEVGVRLYGLVVSEARQFPDLVQAYLDAARNEAIAELTGWLEAKSDQGALSVQSPGSAAGMLIEMVIAEPFRLAALGIGPRLVESEIERRVRDAVGVFLNGVSVTEPRHRRPAISGVSTGN